METIDKLLLKSLTPEFKVVSEIPKELQFQALDKAVLSFVYDSHCKDDKEGLYRQTLENIAGATYFKSPGCFFWLAHERGQVVAYALTHLGKDVDNKLCYWMTQAWVHPDYRHTGLAKKYLRQLREHAKQTMCKHILVVSSRNTKAYLRFLGKAWHSYVEILKEDI